jgi:hypothetical protein
MHQNLGPPQSLLPGPRKYSSSTADTSSTANAGAHGIMEPNSARRLDSDDHSGELEGEGMNLKIMKEGMKPDFKPAAANNFGMDFSFSNSNKPVTSQQNQNSNIAGHANSAQNTNSAQQPQPHSQPQQPQRFELQFLLLDFGFSKTKEQARKELVALTGGPAPNGTNAYIPPGMRACYEAKRTWTETAERDVWVRLTWRIGKSLKRSTWRIGIKRSIRVVKIKLRILP